MLPQYQRVNDEDDDDEDNSKTKQKSPMRTNKLFQVSFGKFSVTVVSLPFFAFLFSILWSLLFFFERSTSTHCSVRNWLPSISAAIGNYQPQRFVWQFAILVHALPRFLITHQYYTYYNEIIRKNRRPIAYTACIFNVVENLALVGLSVWTSLEDYEIHKTCFITFIFTSECYMIMSYFLNKNARKMVDNFSPLELKSLKFKRNLFIVNIIGISFATYFFIRHNDRCETGVYTLFALMEYIVVLTNMGFHMTSYWDFYDKIVVFDFNNGFYLSSNYPYS